MHILVTGFNHTTAPITLRERLAFAEDRLRLARSQLRQMKSIMECVIVSTCNRMELYVVCDQLHTGEYYSRAFLEQWFRIPSEELKPHLYCKKNQEAVNHLFQVVSGLDSMVLGETQILGQIKSFFFAAQQEGTTGTLFNMLFKQAITFGKRVHAETVIGQNPVSVSYAAVELAKKMFASLNGKSILLIGAGKMSELTAKHFTAASETRVQVVNRTLQHAQELAKRFQGEACSWEQLPQLLLEADVVVSSTGATEMVITAEQYASVLQKRTSPIFLIDIAVPRDIEPTLHQIENVFLYNIDDLNDIVDGNKKIRLKEAEKIQKWIVDESVQYLEWVQTLGVIPLISALREKSLMAQEEVYASIERKLPDLTEKQKKVIRKHTKSLVNQFLRDPIVRVKELAVQDEREQALAYFSHLFALENLDNEKEKQAEVTISVKSVNQVLSSP